MLPEGVPPGIHAEEWSGEVAGDGEEPLQLGDGGLVVDPGRIRLAHEAEHLPQPLQTFQNASINQPDEVFADHGTQPRFHPVQCR